MTVVRHAAAWARQYALDAAAVSGVILVAIGLGQYSAPLLPIVIGLGLLATVRFGAR